VEDMIVSIIASNAKPTFSSTLENNTVHVASTWAKWTPEAFKTQKSAE